MIPIYFKLFEKGVALATLNEEQNRGEKISIEAALPL